MTIDDVVFDALSHTSHLPNGRDVPHVTNVLSAVGVSTDFEELASVSSYIGEKIETARLRGTAVHADCHAHDDDDLLLDSVHPAVLPFVGAWADARRALRLEPLARERRLFHPVFFYTGILDGVFLRGRKRIIIDIKTGDPESSAAHLQTAAYDAAWTAMNPTLPIHERWAIQLVPKNRVPYKVKDYTARPDAALDLGKWLACLCVYNEQIARRKKVL